jgi:hypothetical protein
VQTPLQTSDSPAQTYLITLHAHDSSSQVSDLFVLSTYVYKMTATTDIQALHFSSCRDVQKQYPRSESGLYYITDASGLAYQAYCDMQTLDGGWMHLMTQTSPYLDPSMSNSTASNSTASMSNPFMRVMGTAIPTMTSPFYKIWGTGGVGLLPSAGDEFMLCSGSCTGDNVRTFTVSHWEGGAGWQASSPSISGTAMAGYLARGQMFDINGSAVAGYTTFTLCSGVSCEGSDTGGAGFGCETAGFAAHRAQGRVDIYGSGYFRGTTQTCAMIWGSEVSVRPNGRCEAVASIDECRAYAIRNHNGVMLFTPPEQHFPTGCFLLRNTVYYKASSNEGTNFECRPDEPCLCPSDAPSASGPMLFFYRPRRQVAVAPQYPFSGDVYIGPLSATLEPTLSVEIEAKPAPTTSLFSANALASAPGALMPSDAAVQSGTMYNSNNIGVDAVQSGPMYESSNFGIDVMNGYAVLQVADICGSMPQARVPWPTDGLNHHIVGIISTESIELYIDGMLGASRPFDTYDNGTVCRMSTNHGQSAYVGHSPPQAIAGARRVTDESLQTTQSGGETFVGEISEVLVYPVALNSMQVWELFRKHGGPSLCGCSQRVGLSEGEFCATNQRPSGRFSCNTNPQCEWGPPGELQCESQAAAAATTASGGTVATGYAAGFALLTVDAMPRTFEQARDHCATSRSNHGIPQGAALDVELWFAGCSWLSCLSLASRRLPVDQCARCARSVAQALRRTCSSSPSIRRCRPHGPNGPASVVGAAWPRHTWQASMLHLLTATVSIWQEQNVAVRDAVTSANARGFDVSSMWIGGTDSKKPDTWMWEDGVPMCARRVG